MVEGMSVGVNVMLSLMSVMSPPSALYFGCFDFRGELGFLNCDDIYVDLQCDDISRTFTAGYVCLCGVCSPWSVCEVVVVPYVVGAVVAVTVMHVLLFVLHVCMLREC